MKFRTFDPKGVYKTEAIYDPKTRKLAEQIMALHKGMGDGIEILEEDDYDAA